MSRMRERVGVLGFALAMLSVILGTAFVLGYILGRLIL